MFVTVRTFDPRTVERAVRFVAGGLVYVEGRLSAAQRTGADGALKIEIDVKAWHVRLAAIGRRHANGAVATSQPGSDPVRTAVDSAEAAP
jgi:single-stranded DNA-binding protein